MANAASNQALINEAIKRILLDILIRGHGERLIGRWSREPSIQDFLESVPYLLDRINQLHLICMRSEAAAATDSADQRHHLHSHHQHHHHAGQRARGAAAAQAGLHDFVNLIGGEQHWLVRTRDSLGLTPLHKAVLFNNRPIVEFILDRYPDELAAVGSGHSSQIARRSSGGEQRRRRLVDAQDKYGRTALHYAAALLSARAHRSEDPDGELAPSELEHERSKQLSLYKFLLARGADRRLRDFRGKTADFYARHAKQLRVKSIIHLANKLNANYQAVVLSRTLKALTFRGRQIEGQDYMRDGPSAARAGIDDERASFEPASETRESMSISCSELRGELGHFVDLSKAKSRSAANLHLGAPDDGGQLELPTRPRAADAEGASQELRLLADSDNWASSSLSSSANAAAQPPDSASEQANELAKLRADRLERPVLDERTKARVKKCLSDARLEAINELVMDGLGSLVLEQARVACWNAACKRYIANVIPNLLRQLDTLHELVATNQLLALKALVTSEPILARIRRPYKRASMNALHLAVQWNRKSMVAFLVGRLPELVSQTDSQGATCLHWAARSLHSDRLYTWLVDHFGPQLEQLRDRRGKTASDYRQQAIRLASFEYQPAGAENSGPQSRHRRESRSDVERILDRAQMQADELQASGVRSLLIRRPAGAQQAGGHKSRPLVEPHRKCAERTRSTTPPAPIKPDEKRDESAQVGIGIESASSVELSEGVLEATPATGLDLLARQGPDKERPGSRDASATNADANANANANANSNANARNMSPRASDEEAPLAREQFGEQTDVQSTRHAADAADFFAEFGQLEAADLVGGTVYQAGAPDANGASRPLQERPTKIVRATAKDDPNEECSLDSAGSSASAGAKRASSRVNREPGVDIGGEHSAAARNKNLHQIIGDCMASGQFKKLEHMILAGCGQRVQQVYTWTRDAHGSAAALSREMIAFLEGRAIELTRTCQQIHQQIHQCHAQVLLDYQLADERQSVSLDELDENECQRARAHRIQVESARSSLQEPLSNTVHSRTRETLNSNFHKLSSLLQDNAFLMARDKFGASPLHVALIRADGRLLDYLLRRQPNLASAPDHDNRTALHYAAIVLAAFERHGPFKVTDSEARAYWQVDERARQVYENLCVRYGHELASLRDRKAKRGRDYLSQEADERKHTRLENLSRGLYKPQLVAHCCPEYAQMLQRYDYLILVAGSPEQDGLPAEVLNTNQESRSGPNTQASSPSLRMRQQHSSFECSRSLSYAQSRDQEAHGSTSSEPATSKPSKEEALWAEQLGACRELPMVPNSRELHSQLESANVLARRQVAPKPVVGGCDLSFARLAPAGAIETVEPDVPVRGELAAKKSLALATQEQQNQQQKQQRTQVKRLNHSPRRSPWREPVGLDLDTSAASVSRSMAAPGANQLSWRVHDQHRRNKRKNGHHHAQHNKKSDGSSRHASRNKPGRLSVVGGVIVPTIIHNDKMDEIETYDIIYRQPVSKGNSESSSSLTGSCSGSNTSLNSSLLSLNELDNHHTSSSFKHLLATGPDRLSKSPPAGSTRSAISPIPAATTRHKSIKSAKFGKLNGELAAVGGLASQAAALGPDDRGEVGAEEDESDEDEDREEDDRVERLSNEFEERVRREKGELRQKVDQIMREIKSSAKSGKSTRFLASPNDLSALNKPAASSQHLALTDGNKHQASLSSTLDNKSITSSGGSRRSTDGSSSLSSAGCSKSQCNSSSSSSSNLSTGNPHNRTSSCSSSSSSGSTMSSVSSPTTSIGGGGGGGGGGDRRDEKPRRKTVTINEPRRVSQAPVSGVSQTVSFSASVGALNQHLSELTDHLVSKNSYGQTYLHFIASKSQSSSTLYKVLEHGKQLIGERDVFYRTARDVALQFNLMTNVQVLDKYVIDLFIGGQTQLLWMLLNQGYSPLIHVSDPDGNDIMLILKLLKQEHIISYLLHMADFQRWRDELHTFIRHGYSAGVSVLIKKHKDLVRAKSAYSRTSLHLAVLFDRFEMIGELIDMDPSCVQAVDNMGRTPLHYVYGLQLKNGEEIRSKLMEHGASLETRDVRERTPKYYYIFRREIEDIRRVELELN